MGGWAHPVASLTGSVSSSTCWGNKAASATEVSGSSATAAECNTRKSAARAHHMPHADTCGQQLYSHHSYHTLACAVYYFTTTKAHRLERDGACCVGGERGQAAASGGGGRSGAIQPHPLQGAGRQRTNGGSAVARPGCTGTAGVRHGMHRVCPTSSHASLSRRANRLTLHGGAWPAAQALRTAATVGPMLLHSGTGWRRGEQPVDRRRQVSGGGPRRR